MKQIISVLLITFSFGIALGQTASKPKLVVGIVIDQMVYDYLYRYGHRFSEGGFNAFLKQGTNCKNAQFSFVPTYTGPGHATIYTGATPSDHGIVANGWYDRKREESVNCVSDSNYFSVGTESNYGMRSPKNLLCNTITDQLKQASPTSKVIAVSFKDRGAILPGGHLSDGSYWYDYVTGDFITSEFYKKELPKWVVKFNGNGYPEKAMKDTWSTLYKLNTYTSSGPDNSPYEKTLPTKETPEFPYDFEEITKGKSVYSLFPYTPWANTYLTDFAIESIKREELGSDASTDFLCVSYSSPDYAGHAFGPQSIEIEDMYLRLDLEIERLLKSVKNQSGKDVVVFLTADHAVVPVPQLLMDQKLPGGYLFVSDKMKALHDAVKSEFGTDFISVLENNNIYLNEELIHFMGADLEKIESFIVDEVRKWPGVKGVVSTKELRSSFQLTRYPDMIRKGYQAERSGNIIFYTEPGYLTKSNDDDDSRKGTNHGSAYGYDTHVPLLWYGGSIKQQSIHRKVEVVDIVSTLSQLLNLQNSNCSSGQPIIELLK